jgi:SNF2 family DNA or RNA helicase
LASSWLGIVLGSCRLPASALQDTTVWKKLLKFQRDGVVGAMDKLERHGGCIIADSVGLGKTFEALAIIKYYELRNDRVLVLCPKRLRDNWTLYRSNDRRNVLAADRFNYDVLNHTDLSRDKGSSGDIELSHVNWGNYEALTSRVPNSVPCRSAFSAVNRMKRISTNDPESKSADLIADNLEQLKELFPEAFNEGKHAQDP